MAQSKIKHNHFEQVFNSKIKLSHIKIKYKAGNQLVPSNSNAKIL